MASAALACPVAADLDNAGIRFLEAQGEVEVHRRLDANRIEIDFFTPNFPDFSRSIVIHGVYVQAFANFENGELVAGTSAEMRRPVAPEDMPVPVAGLTWSTPQTFVDSSGSFDETMTVEVGNRTSWQLGSCRYAVLPIEITIASSDSAYVESINYLPDLGVGVLTGFTDSEGEVTYTYVDIQAEAS